MGGYMDANKKPQMTREMMIRLSGSLRRSIDGFKAYGLTGRSLKANRKVNSERQYIKKYQSSAVVGEVGQISAKIGVVSRLMGANSLDNAGLSDGNRRANSLQNNNAPSGVDNSRQSFNANRTTFREPPSRGYNPFG